MSGEKIYLLAFDAGKNLTRLHVGEKNYSSRGLGKKKLSPKPNHPYLSQKSNARPVSKARA